MNSHLIALAASLAIVLSAWIAPPQAEAKIPVIFDTDIGDDIDDTWALVMLLKSPNLDVRLITTDYGNTVYRAKIVSPVFYDPEGEKQNV